MDEKRFEHGPLKAGFSGAVGIGWLIFIILFLAFFSEDYRPNEKIAIIILSILILTILLGGSWTFWSLRMMSKKEMKIFKIKGFKWRITGSIIYGLIMMILLIYGFWFIWINFSFWQYIAIILVILLLSGGIMGAIWASWSSKHKEEMDTYGKELGTRFEDGFKEHAKKKEKTEEDNKN